MPDAARVLPLDGIAPLIGPALTMTPLAPCMRLILRGRAAAAAAAAPALGMRLPVLACRSARTGERAALWLGPDEWLILAPADDPLAATLAAALAGVAHALVDVSHRQSGLSIAGSAAATVLNAGCPLDLDHTAFPIGMCTRTVLAKSEIVLWRTGALAFRVEAGRSFVPYVWQYLAEAGREFG